MVSVLIITWKRTALLQKCLESLTPWTALTDLQVVVLVNGPDSDTTEFLQKHSDEHGWPAWREIPPCNPGTARNLGLNELRGEWVFFIDDDASVPPDYWVKFQHALHLLPDADVIGGGDIRPPGSDGLACAVSIALSSPFCVGPTSIRHRSFTGAPMPATEVGLTSCNLWVRRRHIESGLQFPENYQRAEETVFLQDMHDMGGKLWHVPGLNVWHNRRNSWHTLLRTSFNSGFFRSLVMKEKKQGPRWFWLPALFVLLHLTPVISPRAFLPLMGWWFFPVLCLSWLLCVRARKGHLLFNVILLHWSIPFSYGAGFLWQRLGGGPWQR